MQFKYQMSSLSVQKRPLLQLHLSELMGESVDLELHRLPLPLQPYFLGGLRLDEISLPQPVYLVFKTLDDFLRLPVYLAEFLQVVSPHHDELRSERFVGALRSLFELGDSSSQIGKLNSSC